MFRPNAYLSRSQFLSLAGGSALGALSAGLLSCCGSTISTSGSSDSGSSSGGIVTFTVKLAIKQPDDRLKAGMSASCSL